MFYLQFCFAAFKNAFLNVIKIPRRSITSIVVIAFGCLSMILFGGFVESMYDGMRENMIHSQLGHIQIAAKGFEKSGTIEPEKYLISPELVETIQTVVQDNKHVTTITSRYHFIGIISNGNQSTTFLGTGVNPNSEHALSTSIYIRDGKDLYPQQPDGVLLGEGLARGIHANVGDRLTILTTTVNGGMNATDVTVTGIMTTGISDLDMRLIRMELPYVQQLVDTNKITKLVILLDKTNNTEKISDQLIKIIKDKNLPLEIRTWSEMADNYQGVVNLFNGIFGFIKITIIAIILISISSTMLINIMERTREIGTIRSMGATRIDIISNFILEGICIGAIGSILGVIMGILLAKQITAAGILMPRPPGSTVDYPLRIFVENKIIIEAFFIGLITVVTSSIYPAIKAAKMNIVDAIRYV